MQLVEAHHYEDVTTSDPTTCAAGHQLGVGVDVVRSARDPEHRVLCVPHYIEIWGHRFTPTAADD